MPKTAKVFKSGNSQAVRLPKDFRLDVDEVEISKEGEAIILRPLAGKKVPWQHLRAALDMGFSSDFLDQGRQRPGDQDRSDLGELFP